MNRISMIDEMDLFFSPADASIITTSMPLWAMLLAAFFLHEPITAKKVLGIAFGAGGALLLIIGSNQSAAAQVEGSSPVWGDLLVLLAQPLGTISPWFPIVMIGIGGAAHQSWSANIFSTVGDMFPKSAIATVTGIGGMAGGVGSMILQWFAGWLFVHADKTGMHFMGFEGKPAGYFVVFCICAVAYLVGWIVMKALVPKYKPIVIE